MKAETIKASDIMKQVEMNVRIVGMNAFNLRAFIAKKLIELACIILGCNYNVDIDMDDSKQEPIKREPIIKEGKVQLGNVTLGPMGKKPEMPIKAFGANS